MPRTHYVFSEQRCHDFTDKHAADKILDKALGHVTARDLALRAAAAAAWAAMKAKTKIGHETEEDKEKGDEKADTSNSETRCSALSFLPMLGAFGFLIGGQRSESGKRQQSRAMSARRTAISRSHDRAESRTVSPYKYERGLFKRELYLGPYKYEQSVAAKKKKCRKDNKNVVWRNYQCTIERARKTFARTIL